MDLTLIRQAYALIGGLGPSRGDCGAFCGKACCSPDEDGKGGMLLFPGEELLLKDEPWCTIAPCAEGLLLTCGGTCVREKRPLACRIFPLTPFFREGELRVRTDARARAVCPLVANGVRGLRQDYARAVRDALRLLCTDPDYAAFLSAWQAAEERFRSFSL